VRFLKCIYEKENIKLNAVEEALKIFLASKGFTYSVNRVDQTRVEIEGFCRIKDYDKGFVRIILEGKPDKLVVDFQTPIENEPLLKIPSLLTMFGFGFIFRKKVELYEFYRRLEDDFYQYLDKVCLSL